MAEVSIKVYGWWFKISHSMVHGASRLKLNLDRVCALAFTPKSKGVPIAHFNNMSPSASVHLFIAPSGMAELESVSND